MKVTATALKEVLLLDPVVHEDLRGTTYENYNKRSLREAAGIDVEFVQDNHSLSVRAGTVRGLHFQVAPSPQAKLIRVVRGAVFDVAVDLRKSSPSYGRHVATTLSAANMAQMYLPIGFAHGFCTLEPDTEVVYKVSDYYDPAAEKGLLWNDPALNIAWPVEAREASLSEKDKQYPPLSELGAWFT